MWKQTRFAERIEKNGLLEPPKLKVKKTNLALILICQIKLNRTKASFAQGDGMYSLLA